MIGFCFTEFDADFSSGFFLIPHLDSLAWMSLPDLAT